MFFRGCWRVYALAPPSGELSPKVTERGNDPLHSQIIPNERKETIQ